MSEWFENESFWKETYDFLFPEKLFIETNEQVASIFNLVGFNGPSILDLCCEPGRCSIVLAKKGFSVTGVDRSPFLLNKAKERTKSEGLSVEWVLEDMRRFIRPESYDLVLSMFTSFGYFGDKKDDINVLENVLANRKERLREKVRVTREALAIEHLQNARNLIETCCFDEARKLLELAQTLTQDEKIS
jgi:SAM-dependent methyltransferase